MVGFNEEVRQRIAEQADNDGLLRAAHSFLVETARSKYSYNFSFLGRPIIQYPQDMVAVQELIWEIKPDLIIETGIAHGGSLIMSAGILALLDVCEAIETGQNINPSVSMRKVVGVDIDIRPHNRAAIETHPMASRIQMFEGSSVDADIVRQITEIAANHKRVMVFLDSNHTHEHVYSELQAYAGLTSPGSYCVVFDTLIENMPTDMYPDRNWGPGDNPMSAVHEFLADHPEFEIDKSVDAKLLVSVSPMGYLRRVG
ncbi:MAG: cephalosporin hydroxylase family protein [Nitratireductor sp.]|nr:cephalosporin hydroxylase family protein [Nitratireductor sp.]